MNSIWIIYSLEESVLFCMWKYFFQSCGVMVISQTTEQFKNGVTKDDQETTDQRPFLYILSEGDMDLIADKEKHLTAYLISSNLYKFHSYSQRKDIFPILWNDKAADAVLEKLAKSHKDSLMLRGLFKLFVKCDLWGMSWLYHEINLKRTGPWDQEIIQTCRFLVNYLDQFVKIRGNNSYCSFMRIYCNYIKAGAQDRSEYKQIKNVTELMGLCREYIDEFEPSSSIYFLMGKICSLSPAEEKTALLSYKNIAFEDYTPELLYIIGREYEKCYGDMKSARDYYLESYGMNQNYKALYKFAVKYDEEKKWESALSLYECILKKVRNLRNYDAITVSDIEYEYKVSLKIAAIYKSYLKADDLAWRAKEYLNEMFWGLGERTDFNQLLFRMFGNSRAGLFRNQLLEEIERKFQTPCFSSNVI